MYWIAESKECTSGGSRFYVTPTCFCSDWAIIRELQCKGLYMTHENKFSLQSANHASLRVKHIIVMERDWSLPQYIIDGGVHELHTLMKTYTYISCLFPCILSPWWWLNRSRNMWKEIWSNIMRYVNICTSWYE
jgi:hypothetical protein